MTNLFGTITAELDEVEYQGRFYRLDVAERILQTGTDAIPVPMADRIESGWTDEDGVTYLGPEFESVPVFESEYLVVAAYELDGDGNGTPVTLEMTPELRDIVRDGIESSLGDGE